MGVGNERVFELVNDAFLLVYSSALLTRVLYHCARYFQDGFNNFDILHVSVSLLERVFFGAGNHVDRTPTGVTRSLIPDLRQHCARVRPAGPGYR